VPEELVESVELDSLVLASVELDSLVLASVELDSLVLESVESDVEPQPARKSATSGRPATMILEKAMLRMPWEGSKQRLWEGRLYWITI